MSENSENKPSDKPKKPVPTKRVMVDLELDDSWLGEDPGLRIEPVRLKETKMPQPIRENKNVPEPTEPDLPVVQPIREVKPRRAKPENVQADARSAESKMTDTVVIPKEGAKSQPQPTDTIRDEPIPGLRGEMTVPTEALRAQRAAPERPLEAVVVDTVGEVPPVVLGAGIFGGLTLFILLAILAVLSIVYGEFSFSPLPDDPVIEQFDNDTSEKWSVQRSVDDDSMIIQEAYFEDDAYRLTNRVPSSLFWSSAGLRLGVGTYQVDIEFMNDQAETGAGLAILQEDGAFFVVEIGPDGYAWIGRCDADCATAEPLVENGWFAVDSIKQGAGTLNQLKVEMRQSQLVVLVNGTEIGYVDDSRVRGVGDVALLVESGESGFVSAVFDNFEWSP